MPAAPSSALPCRCPSHSLCPRPSVGLLRILVGVVNSANFQAERPSGSIILQYELNRSLSIMDLADYSSKCDMMSSTRIVFNSAVMLFLGTTFPRSCDLFELSQVRMVVCRFPESLWVFDPFLSPSFLPFLAVTPDPRPLPCCPAILFCPPAGQRTARPPLISYS